MLAFVMPGGTELLIIFGMLVLLFGAKQLPKWARAFRETTFELNKARREFDEDETDTKNPS